MIAHTPSAEPRKSTASAAHPVVPFSMTVTARITGVNIEPIEKAMAKSPWDSPGAALLTALAEPASSTELGVRFGVTASAVNQHLRALKAGRLVNSTRYGHSVLYLRSELGAALLGGVSSLDDDHVAPHLDRSEE